MSLFLATSGPLVSWPTRGTRLVAHDDVMMIMADVDNSYNKVDEGCDVVVDGVNDDDGDNDDDDGDDDDDDDDAV
jgi:hypothetical protein